MSTTRVDTAELSPAEQDGTGLVRIDVHVDGSERTLGRDVRCGLTGPFKELPPKHFYDSRGSALFDRICELPEYYPTRVERAILAANAGAIVAAVKPRELVELGSGSPAKAKLLLEPMARAGLLQRYVPVDVSERVVREAADALISEYPGLRVHGVVADFERHLERIPPSSGRRLVAFLGGTIGNLPAAAREQLLRDIARMLGPDDRCLLGTDLVKDTDTLELAYDDSAGVTAEFNRNVLHVINRELDANFDPQAFDHVAFFDREREWIEMRLRSRAACRVRIAALDLDIAFGAGEELRTEISAKFTRARVEREFGAAGLELDGWLTDPDELFAVSLARRR